MIWLTSFLLSEAAADVFDTCVVRTPAGAAVDLAAVPTVGYEISQKPVGERLKVAIVYKVDGKSIKLPVAVGFCGLSSAVRSDGPSPDLAPASWTGTDCAIVSTAGKSAQFNYKPYDDARASFSGSGWPWGRRVSADRSNEVFQTPNVRITKISGNSLRATEYFYRQGSDAANVLLFDKVSAQDGAAVAICGYNNLVRRVYFR